DADESAEEKPEVATETKVTVYELHVSSRAPIGEDTKAYIRVGEESAVGTIMKTVADKLKPEMSEWRDMRVTTANVSMATRIELATSDGAATFVKGDGGWTFEDDGEVAESEAVEALLDAVRDLKATAFVDGPPDDLVALGLDRPQADIKLTIPGVEDVERIAVGGYTDAHTKRLVYVRRNEIASVAKVRAAEVDVLTRGLQAYRDRTVFNVPADQIVEIAISAKNQFGEGRMDASFTRTAETWSMSLPVEVTARDEQLKKLAEALAGLQAESVVGSGEELSAYGLDDPAVTVKFRPGPEADPLELAVSEHDRKVYAKRGDRGSVYELTLAFYGQLLAEHRAREVLTFDDSAVLQFSIRRGDVTHAFARAGEGWTYGAEPDLPLDPRKVTNLLLQLRDLRTEQFVDHATTELGPWDLTAPEHEVTVALQDGTYVALLVSKQVCPEDSQGRYYAAVRGQPGVFLMSTDTIARFAVSLDELEASP
ncbi:MAG: DUF4340 domain-containing protein, partial [Planctomycetes bacterium]|nr:DUF4340 domain-containing protein [Planctomycetota bacterium]